MSVFFYVRKSSMAYLYHFEGIFLLSNNSIKMPFLSQLVLIQRWPYDWI